MVKDYFQDIVPASHDDEQDQASDLLNNDSDTSGINEHSVPIRSIRNITSPNREWSTAQSSSAVSSVISSRPNRRMIRTSLILWTIAGVCVLVLAVFALFAMRSTTVTITPRSQVITFDKTTQFRAYPAATAATGTLSYMVVEFDVQDSEIVATQGTIQAEHKASGTISVYNNYSSAPVKLIKNTRFQTEAGLVFRVPSDVVIPAKSATVPGQVNVTVIADKTGSSYNVPSGSTFKLPGLVSSPKEYAGVYARASSDIVGGFSGTEPAVAPADQATAISQIRARLENKINDIAIAHNTATTTALRGLAHITYTDAVSSQTASSTSVSLNETAHVQLPVFTSVGFIQNVAQDVVIDTENTSITFIPGKDFVSLDVSATSTAIGTQPLSFVLSGNAQLLWSIDTQAFVAALVGRDGGAFNTIITGFPGVVEAHARIEPFWKNTFPNDQDDIKIIITEPQPIKR